ncbi:MAG TPA: dihydrofolate reductase family protein [Micromonosporaceae bacterium]|jgi:dihydrofolate reductase
MKLTTVTQISVDGVMQANGPSEAERAAGFERDGWAIGHFDEESTAYVEHLCERADAFLFGRWTYDVFAGYWGAMAPGSGPIADSFNARPKYVASTTLAEPTWAETTVLSHDLAAAIGDLKAGPAGELQVHGSGKLVRWLLAHDLVDEMQLIVAPVVVGQGTRLFADNGPDIALDLVESRPFPKGMTLQVYRTAGRPHYQSAGSQQ